MVRYSIKGLAIASVGALFSISAWPTNAAVITEFSDRMTFNTAAGGGLMTETFNSFANDTPFHTTSIDVGAFTISMTGTPDLPNSPSTTTASNRNNIDVPPLAFALNIDGTNIMNVLTVAGVSLVFSYDAPITAFGADFAAWHDTFAGTELVIGGADLLMPPLTFVQVHFYGFVSDTPFSTVEFRGLRNDGYGIDNVTFGNASVTVPEPSTLALFAIGLAGLGVMTRRRRKQSDSASVLGSSIPCSFT